MARKKKNKGKTNPVPLRMAVEFESIIEINNILEQHINGKSSIYFIIHLRNQIIEIELEKTYNLTPDIQSEINHLNGVKQISER